MLNRNTKPWKRGVEIALVAVLAADAGLLLARWRLAEAASRQQLRATAERLKDETARLQVNLDEAASIRRHLPRVGHDCDQFFNQQLLGMKDGYASLVADLGEVADHAGLHASALQFEQKELEKRGVTEVDANATIEGDYPSLIRFINGLERSKNFYLLDSLSLASSSPDKIKLNVHLRTYFRSQT